jgi:hypothetical protein
MSVYRVGGNKSSQNVFPSVRPTLDLDFANSKTLDPRITFTRASGGSYVGADGLIKLAGVNEARFDHDPETGESLGLLIEEARTNLLLRSEEFTSPWSYIGASSFISNILSPNGINYSTKLVESNLLEPHFLFSGASVTNGLQYTASIYAKAAERSWVNLSFQATGLSVNAWANFNLNTGEIGRFGSAVIPNITKFPNGWYKCSITATAILTTSVGGLGVSPISSDINSRLPSYQGDGVSGIYIWGAQEEQGAFPTSYIPTLGSTRTRAADNASITGKNFSEWYRQDEGTVYSNITVNEDISSALFSKNHILFSLNDGSLTNRITLFANNNSRSLIGRYDALGNTFSLALTNLSTSKFMRTTYSFKLSDIQLSNSSAKSTSFPPYYPIVNRLQLGNQLGFIILNGHHLPSHILPKKTPQRTTKSPNTLTT